SYFFSKFLNFIEISKASKNSKKVVNLKEIYEQSKYLITSVFYKSQIKIGNESIPSHIVTGVLNKNIDKVLQDTKAKVCIYCESNLTSRIFITPCGCHLCSISCLHKYLDFIINIRKKH